MKPLISLALLLTFAPSAESADEGWSRVRKLQPGAEVTVTIRGSQAVRRYFVSADDLRLTVLNPAGAKNISEIHARDDVAEVARLRKGRGVWGHLGAFGGYFVGGMAGGFVSGLACQAARGRGRCDTGAFLGGMLVGGVAGGIQGFRAARRETEDVIYRAP